MNKKLLSCPFCNGKPNYSMSCQDGYMGRCSIYCSNCGAGISGYENKEEVLRSWNTRQKAVRKVRYPEENNGLQTVYAQGWNAAIDEMRKLNEEKP